LDLVTTKEKWGEGRGRDKRMIAFSPNVYVPEGNLSTKGAA